MRDDDAELLRRARREPDAFGVFYSRHERAVLGYFVLRVRDAETAGDLSAETFAQALLSVGRYRGDRGVPTAWLFGIAANLLASHYRRGEVEQRARRRLGVLAVRPTAAQLDEIARLEADLHVEVMLENLPDAQRAA